MRLGRTTRSRGISYPSLAWVLHLCILRPLRQALTKPKIVVDLARRFRDFFPRGFEVFLEFKGLEGKHNVIMCNLKT